MPPDRVSPANSHEGKMVAEESAVRFIDLIRGRLSRRGTLYYRCRTPFRLIGPCDEGEIGAFISRLCDAKYSCTCGASFHGACAVRGRSGEAPRSVLVTCPKCGTETSYPMPFQVEPYSATRQ
jgi:hypothetical protein